MASSFETGSGRGAPESAPPEKTGLDRLLGLAAEVHAGEGLTALLLSLNGFLLLSAYYTIRPLRSALLLPVRLQLPGGGVMSGSEITSYVGAGFAAFFLVIVPLYSAIASKVNRIRLINSVTLFFVVTLIGFFFLGRAEVYPELVAVAFFLWIGIFSLMVIAQFWSFANDLYTPEQGKRLFAIVGFGGSVGAIAGALIASTLTPRLGILPIMLVGSGELLAALALTNVIHTRDQHRPKAVVSGAAAEKPLSRVGGFRLVLGEQYLLLIGLLTLTVNIVNTNGNYILNETLSQMARASVEAGASGEGAGTDAVRGRAWATPVTSATLVTSR